MTIASSTKNNLNKSASIYKKMLYILFGPLGLDELESDRNFLFIVVYLAPISSFLLTWMISGSLALSLTISACIILIVFLVMGFVVLVDDPQTSFHRSLLSITIQGLIFGLLIMYMYKNRVEVIEPVKTIKRYHDTTRMNCPDRMLIVSSTYTTDICWDKPLYNDVLNNAEKYDLFLKTITTSSGVFISRGLEIRYKDIDLGN